MKVSKLYLENFLSYENLYCEFSDGLNVLVGRNAAGKTNLAESIFYCSVGKSARGLKDKELINWNASDGARIRLRVEKKYSSHTVDIRIDKQGKKRITIDELPISRMGELMGVINTVYFSPDEMRLIKESPADRRRFIDMSLCQRDKLYFYKLNDYNRLLVQRNKLLKNYRQSPSLNDMCGIINVKLAELQDFIIKKRLEFIEKISPLADARHRKITGNKEGLALSYETEDVDVNDVKNSVLALYEQNFEKDCRLEYTTVGIHRDDLKISAGGIDVRKYGSQGQQRTSALSLKLAETDSFYLSTGEYPLLILDDVASELDGERQKALFENLDGIQTVVTATSVSPDFVGATVYDIKDNNIFKRS